MKGRGLLMDNLIDEYLKKLNNEILNKISYNELENSYGTQDKTYAKEILKDLYDAFLKVYKTNYINSNHDYIIAPAVIQSTKNNNICIGLVELDIQSSGEHCGTYFLCKYGAIRQGDWENMKPNIKEHISSSFMPYNYYYTVYLERDHHVDFENVPNEVNEMLSFATGEEIGFER
jgi:hypothetical protein